mmetsp:Transcript_7794/g.10386  ORF Transcript_7794/g.10386 Transcript_7794/m.10386 type:complete len:86 (-) Transcript_7794:1253-1510(-)
MSECLRLTKCSNWHACQRNYYNYIIFLRFIAVPTALLFETGDDFFICSRFFDDSVSSWPEDGNFDCALRERRSSTSGVNEVDCLE